MTDQDRRRFLQESALIGASLALGASCEPNDDETFASSSHALLANSIYGYAARASVFEGGVLRLHYWTDQPSFRVLLYRHRAALELVHTTSWITATPHAAEPADVSSSWDWPFINITLDSTFVAGVYIAAFEARNAAGTVVVASDGTPHGVFGKALFIIRPPAARASILYKLSYATYQAYNSTGGSSMYEGLRLGTAPNGSGGTHQGYKLTFLRPGGGTGGTNSAVGDGFDPTPGGASPLNSFPHWDIHFISWFEARGLAVDYCTDVDLHQEDSLLAPYRLMISAGHDEYWSHEMREHVDSFVRRGGNIAFFSGNICWWRIYFVDEDGDGYPDGFVCDKRINGGYGGGDGVDNWWRQRPENSTTGLSTRLGGWVYPPPSSAYGYTIQRASSWIYAGTGVSEGATFGVASRLIAYEFDGIDHEPDPDLPGARRPTTRDGSPASFVILGLCTVPGSAVTQREPIFAGLPARSTLGYFTNCGTVFNGGTTEWPRSLALADPVVDRITRNVVYGLSSARTMVTLTDFNNDGRADIYYTLPIDYGTAIGVWTMRETIVTGGGYVALPQVAGWTFVDAADFDRNNINDLIFQNRATGQMAIWLLGSNRLNIAGGQYISRTALSGWTLVAARDFDGDLYPDLVFYNATTGQISVWFMNGSAFVREVFCDQTQDPAFTLITARDFDGNGRPDLVFYNRTTGQISVWLLGGVDGVTHTQTLFVDRLQDPAFVLVGAGDLDADGRPDLLFQHPTTGALSAWFLGGAQGVTFLREASVPGEEVAPACGPAFRGWQDQPGGGTYSGDTPTIALLPNGALGSFGRGTDSAIWFTVHTFASSWQPWIVISGATVDRGDRVATTTYADGRVVAFVRGNDGAIRFSVQSSTDVYVWSAWIVIPGLTMSSGDVIGCARAGDGRLVVIARRASAPGAWASNAINWETSPGSGTWRGWQDQPVGGTLPKDTCTLATLADGRIASFGRGTDSLVYLSIHSFATVWQPWLTFGGIAVGNGDRIAVGAHSDGRLVIFVRDIYGAVRSVTQTNTSDPYAWSAPQTVPGATVASGDPLAVVSGSTGRLELFTRGSSGALIAARESAEGVWCTWVAVPGLQAELGDGFVAARDGDGHIAVMNRRAAGPGAWSANAIDWELS